MVAVPAATPVTTPVEKPTKATEPALLLQVPPPVVSLKVVVLPTQTWLAPVIGPIIANDAKDNNKASIVKCRCFIRSEFTI